MATTVKALAFVFIYFTFSVQPATAAPNVFWTFGFDRHYALAAGGRADLPARVVLAAKRPATPFSVTHDAVQETLPPVSRSRAWSDQRGMQGRGMVPAADEPKIEGTAA